MLSISPNEDRRSRNRRRWIGICFLAFVILSAIDSVPFGAFRNQQWKHQPARFMRHLGIATGPWMMFTPDPVCNTVWISATIDHDDKPSTEWTSPAWGDVGGIEKFIRFRELNYCNRVVQPGAEEAAEDFARYLSRSAATPAEPNPRVTLYAGELKLIPPSNGGIPKRDEVIRVLQNRMMCTVGDEP